MADVLLRRLRAVAPDAPPPSHVKFAGWDAKSALERVAGNWHQAPWGSSAPSPRLTPGERRAFEAALPWLVAWLEQRRQRQEARGYRPDRFDEAHSAWKEEISAAVAAEARELLGPQGRGNVLVLDAPRGRNVRSFRLRSTAALKRRSARLRVHLPNPDLKIVRMGRNAGAAVHRGTAAEALEGPWRHRRFLAGYMDVCHGTVPKAQQDLAPLLARLRRRCALAVTLTSRDASGGGPLLKRALDLGGWLEREHGFALAKGLAGGVRLAPQKAVVTLLLRREG